MANATGTVTLDSAAPAGGLAVTLSSNNAAASVPSSVTVAQGSTSAIFAVATSTVTANASVTLTATYSAVNKTAILTVTTPTAIPASFITGTVTNGALSVPVQGAIVTVTGTAMSTATDGSGAFAIPVPPGTYSLTVTAPTLQPATTGSLAVTSGSSTSAGTVALGAVNTFTIGINPTVASGTGTATATITLVANAPTGGKAFTLSSDSANLTVPASVTVPASTRVLTFPVTYVPVATTTWVTVSATSAGVTNQAHVTLTQGAAIASLSLGSSSVHLPTAFSGKVYLTAPAPAGGLAVGLSSSAALAATVPASVFVPEGAYLGIFYGQTLTVASNTAVTITASLANGSVSAPVFVTAAPALLDVSAPPFGRTGTSLFIQVNLNDQAPATGAVVSLTSSNPAAVPVPATVTVNSCCTAGFASPLLGSATSSPVVITATYGGLTRATSVTVTTPITAQYLNVSPVGPATSVSLYTSAAVTGGGAASFYSSNPSVASIPTLAAIPRDSTSADTSATVSPLPYDTQVVLSGAFGGRDLQFTLDVPPGAAPSLVNLGASLQGGTGRTGTVSLSFRAPAGGVTIALASDTPGVLSVPGSVAIAAGTTSANFSYVTNPVPISTTVSVVATAAGVSQAGSVTVLAPAVSSCVIAPTSMSGGNSGIGTLTLTGAAPAGGALVSLSSSNASIVGVPAALTVPAGSSTTTFPVTTVGVSVPTNVNITASAGGASRTAALTVNPAVPTSVTFNPATVQGGNPSTGTMTLDGAAPASGGTASLSSLSSSAAVPASVPVAGGAFSATFPVTTSTVVQTMNAGIRATYLGFNLTGTLVITQLPAALASVTVAPAAVSGGLPATGRATLSTAAPAGGLAISLSSSNASVATPPPSVTVPAGATIANFSITTFGVASSTVATISGSTGGVTQSALLTVDPAILQSVSLSPFSLVGGASSQGTVSLMGNAPAAGLVLALASSDTNVATVPPNVTILAGASSATFAIGTNAAVTNGAATISATGGYRNLTQSAVLTLTPAPVVLASFSLSAATTVGGGVPQVVGTAVLNAPAPSGGAYVLLSSSDSSAAYLQTGVTIPSGSTSGTFTIATRGIASAVTVTISAAYNGVTRTAPLTVNPAALTSLVLNTAAIDGGLSVSGVVALNGLAPPSGAAVALSSSVPGTAVVPASVTISAGTQSAAFSVSTNPVAVSTSVVITASYAAASVTAPLSVDPLGLAGVSIPGTQKAGDFSSGTVTLNGPAPPGGFTVDMTASGAVRFDVVTQAGTVAASAIAVSIPAGATYAYFDMIAPWDSAGGTGTVTATLGGVTRSAAMTVTPGTATFTIAPSAVSRGGSTLGAIVFDGFPPFTNSIPVTLSSSNPGIVLTAASASACPILPCGTIGTIGVGTAWSFPVGVTTGSATGTTTISATFKGLTQTAPLSVSPSLISSLVVRPSAFPGGVSIPVTLTLDSPAPPEGALISFTSSNPALLAAPAYVTIPAGQTSLSFNVVAESVASATPISLSAAYGASAKTASVRILANGAARVFGTVLDATVYDHDQPLAGVSASLTTDSTNTTITDAQGAFTLYVDPGTSAVNLSLSGFATTALTSFTASANGSIDTGITRLKRILSGPQTVSGRVITAASSAVPDAAGIVEGYQGTFTTDASGNYSFSGPSLGRYRLTFAKAGFTTRSDDTFVFFSTGSTSNLYDFVLDTAARPVLAAVSVGPNPVVGGVTAFLRLTLSAPAPSAPPPSGATVSLVFSNPAATGGYTSATIPAGALFSDFSIATNVVAAPTSTVITAFHGGVQLAATLNVIPATGVLTSLSVSPASVFGGLASTGTVALNGPAPAVGVAVTLFSNDAAVVVPASVTVPQGGTTATFTVTTSLVGSARIATITAAYGNTRTAALTVNPAPPANLLGVAPGWVLPGDTTPVLYGSNILAGSTVTLTGPVYSIAAPTAPVCTVGGTCPSSALAATIDVGGAYAAFAIPPGASAGIYHLKVRSAAGVDSANNQWIAVDSAQQTRAVVSPALHRQATRIHPGQVVTGTLTGDNPSGDVADYNYYYFVATAGSRISAAMNRVNTSIPWENPASLDPQLLIIAPDGFVYGNLQGIDNQPGIDLNASITSAILPQTGLYFIRAGTTRGSGQYQLSFNIAAIAPAPVGNRAIPVGGNHNSLPLNTPANVQSLMLDARGWPVAGASYTFTRQNGTGDTGTAAFLSGSSGPTSLNGTADASFKMTSQGKARFKPSLDSPQLSQLVYVPFGEAAARLADAYDEGSGELRIPVFRAVARSSIRLLGISEKGAILSAGTIERLPGEQLRPRFDVKGDFSGKNRAPQAGDSVSIGESTPSGAPLRTGATALSVVRQPLTISSCSGELEVFTQAGVNAASLNLPFTATLTDLTPSTGQSIPNGLVDTATGIHGHRIENPDGTSKKIRLKIDVKDSAGNAPTHPVLVSLSVGGSRHGTLIVDPDGNKVECTQASFLWHERDAQGAIIAPNEEFEYRLGTLATYVGATPDPARPGQVLPVWGTTEGLDLTIRTVDGTGETTPLTAFTASFDVHPEPGKPNRFLSPFEILGRPDPNTYDFWADYLTNNVAGILRGGPYLIGNSYYLVDRWNNVTFGYANTVSPAPAPQNITVTFLNQLAGGSRLGYDIGFPGYEMDISWSNSGGSMPSGSYGVPLTVNYTDGDYGTGTVVKTITLSFISGTLRALISQHDYDQRFGVDDRGWPISVSPGAAGGALPTTNKGDKKRLCFQIVSGTNVPYLGEIFETPHNVWVSQSGGYVVSTTEARDPHLEVSDLGRFKISVVDPYAMPVTDIAFQVHPCPRYDHEGPPNQGQPGGQAGRPCTDTVVASVAGVIPIYSVNQGADNRGYMGVELLQAPKNPGNYYIQVESLDSNYRVRQLPGLTTDPTAAGEFKGAFAMCVVQAAEILDQNFQRTNPIVVEEPTQAYVRMTDPSVTGGSLDLTMTTYDSKKQPISADVPLTLSRLGNSTTFLAPITFQPKDYTAPQARYALFSGPTLLAEYVDGLAEAKKAGATVTDKALERPAQFKIQYLDEQRRPSTTQVTRIVALADPAQPGHTVYAEETWVRFIAAKKNGDPADVSGALRLDEKVNTAFPNTTIFTTTRDWQYSYQGEVGGLASDLRPNRITSPDPFEKIFYAEGYSQDIQLRSLSGPRRDTDAAWVQRWDATLLACEWDPSTPCALASDARVKKGTGTVSQWVDQQRYTQNSTPGAFQRTDGSNGVRDWLEANAWDARAKTAAQGGVPALVAGCNVIMWENFSYTGGLSWAVTYIDTPPRLEWHTGLFNFDALRWNSPLGTYENGFKVARAETLSAIALHESRHCWQYSFPNPDHDELPANPDGQDPGALRIKDAQNQFVGGSNNEGHFGGDTVDDSATNNLSREVIERDGNYFTQAATQGTQNPTILTSALSQDGMVVSLNPAASVNATTLNVRVGATITAAIQVGVSGLTGVVPPSGNTIYEPAEVQATITGLVIELTVSNGSGITLAPQRTASPYRAGQKYVAVASPVAQVDLVAGTQPETATITITARKLVPAADAPGAVLAQQTINITVTP